MRNGLRAIVRRLRPALLLGFAAAAGSGASQAICSAPPDFLAPARDFPRNGDRTVVILGSSTAAGAGASDYQYSWAARLAGAIAGSGFHVLNLSISSTTTQDSLNRFAKDVAPVRPDFVVLATSLWNESFAANPQSAAATYLNNTAALVGLVRGLGAVPVLAGVYPNNASTAAHVTAIQQIYRTFETFGDPVWDLWDGLAQPDGTWSPGMSVDGTHPTDLGHQNIFNAIPISAFPGAYIGLPAAGSASSGSWVSSEGAGLTVDLAAPSVSWSVLVSEMAPGSAIASSLGTVVSFNEGLVQLQRSVSGYVLLVMGKAVAAIGLAPSAGGRVERDIPQATDSLALAYDDLRNVLTAYRNGSPVAAAGTVELPPVTRIVFGNGCVGCSLANIAIYRTRLADRDISSVWTGQILRKSLELWSPLPATPAFSPTNLAGTSTALQAAGAWWFNPALHSPPCRTAPSPPVP